MRPSRDLSSVISFWIHRIQSSIDSLVQGVLPRMLLFVVLFAYVLSLDVASTRKRATLLSLFCGIGFLPLNWDRSVIVRIRNGGFFKVYACFRNVLDPCLGICCGRYPKMATSSSSTPFGLASCGDRRKYKFLLLIPSASSCRY